MHGGVHPHEVGAPYWPRVARRKKQLLDHDIIRLAGCVPQPPDSVPPHMVSHVMIMGMIIGTVLSLKARFLILITVFKHAQLQSASIFFRTVLY